MSSLTKEAFLRGYREACRERGIDPVALAKEAQVAPPQPRPGEYVPPADSPVNVAPTLASGAMQTQGPAGGSMPKRLGWMGSPPQPKQAFRHGPLAGASQTYSQREKGEGSLDSLDPRNMSAGAQQAQQASQQQLDEFQTMTPEQREQWRGLQQPVSGALQYSGVPNTAMSPAGALESMGVRGQNASYSGVGNPQDQQRVQQSISSIMGSSQPISQMDSQSMTMQPSTMHIPSAPAQGAPAQPVPQQQTSTFANQVAQAHQQYAQAQDPQQRQQLAQQLQFLKSQFQGDQMAWNRAIN